MSKKISKELAVDLVRRRFWSHGYSVKTLPKGSVEYDLLLDGNKKVLVIVGVPEISIEARRMYQGVDMVAFIVKDKHSGANTIYFGVPGMEAVTVNPKEVVAQVDEILKK